MTGEGRQAAPDAPSEPAGEHRLDPRVDVPDADPPRDDAELRRESAPRRTLLAAERTYLAWLRTGLGAIAVSVAVGRVAPALVGGSNLAYALLGAGYGVLGNFFIVYALVRARRLDAALAADAPVTLDWWALVITTVMGFVLAIATIAMVLTEL
jgi:putative membrane protein